jgi:hypothetical protein
VDYLFPFVERPDWLFFGQGGASFNDQGRLLAYLGLGQRFFPQPDWAIGYNAFVDSDLERAHYRAGLGLELWSRQVKLAANLYQGLGPWRKSLDYPQWPVLERAASGWDIRAEGRLPFAPSLALTGSVGKWRGGGASHSPIGSFTPYKRTQGRSFSYGLNWSPWPFLTASLSQTQIQGQKAQLSLGLALTVRPGVAWSEQTLAAKPQLARHDFVDRDYQMPLAYQGLTIHRITLMSDLGQGLYRFAVKDGFGQVVKNLAIHVSIQDPKAQIYDPGKQIVTKTFLTDSSGEALAQYRSPTGTPTLATLKTSHGQGEFLVTPLVSPPPNPSPSPPDSEKQTPQTPEEPVYAVFLKQAQTPNFVFGLKDQNDEPVPNQAITGEILDGSVQIYGSRARTIASRFVTNPKGEFEVSLGPQPGHPETDLALTPEKGARQVFTLPLPHELALQASASELTSLTATDIVLTLLFNNAPLAQGTAVKLTGTPGGWANLPAHELVGEHGQIALPALTVLSTGTLTIEAEVAGYSAGIARFLVSDPLRPDTLTLAVEPKTIKLGEATSLTLAILKNGSPLSAGEEVSLRAGLGLGNLPTQANLTGPGELTISNAVGLALGQTTLQVQQGSTLSNIVTLTVEPNNPVLPVPPDTLSLAVSPGTIKYGESTALTLTILKNGSPLPAGTEVSLRAGLGLGNLPAQANLTGLGELTIAAVGLSLGQTTIQIQQGSILSNMVTLTVEANESVQPVPPDALTLAVNPKTLKLGESSALTLTILKNGSPLPAGEEVSLRAGLGLGNLPAQANLTGLGELTIATVGLALGQTTIQVQQGSILSNMVTLTVEPNNPVLPVPPDALSLAVSPGTIKYGESSALSLAILKNGAPLPVGTEVSLLTGLGLGNLPTQANLTGLGELTIPNAVGLALGQTTIQVQQGALLSNAVTLTVEASGTLALQTLTPTVDWLNPTTVTLALSLNGQPLPAGLQVNLLAGDGFANYPTSQTSQTGGLVSLPNLVARKAGPIYVAAETGGLTSNQVPITVIFDNGQLAMTAQPQSLEWLVPTQVTFALTYQGQELPAGISVNLTSPDQSLGNLPAALTKTGGIITAPKAQALKPTGVLTAEASVTGFTHRPSVSFGAFVQPAGFTAEIGATTDQGGGGLGGANFPDAFLVSCQPNWIRITLGYQGQIVANTPVTVTGFQLDISGQPQLTNAMGEIFGVTEYGKQHQSSYALNSNYAFEIAGVTVSWPGPPPMDFKVCKP